MKIKNIQVLKWTILLLLTICNTLLIAQNKIAISKRTPLFVDMRNISNAGLKGEVIADNSQWLNYTVMIDSSDPTVSISVNIASGSVPEGLEMYVEAGRYKGFSRSRMGKPVGRVLLTHVPRVLINGIGTSYSGSGRNEGHQLTFSFKIKDYSKLEPGQNTIYVEYTITQ